MNVDGVGLTPLAREGVNPSPTNPFEAIHLDLQPDATDGLRGAGIHPRPGSPAAGEPEGPKIEEILVHMLLKEAKILGDGGDARTPLAGQALVDHLVGRGALDLGLKVDP